MPAGNRSSASGFGAFLRFPACMFLCVCITPFVSLAAFCQASDSNRANAGPVKLPATEGKDLRFVHLSVGEERSHNRVSHIVRDHVGFLWFGTQDGLQRFDGYRLKRFRHDPQNPNSLSGSYVNALTVDSSGSLWIGSDSYLDRYDPATEKFTHYPPDQIGAVSHILSDSEGTIWISTRQGLKRLNPVSGKIVSYWHRADDPASLSSDLIRSTYEQRNGTFWVATSEALDVFDRKAEKVLVHIPLRRSPRAEPLVAAGAMINLLEDHLGVLWLAYSSGNGLARIDPVRKEVVEYALPYSASADLPTSGVVAIHEDHNGMLWLATNAGGLLKLDRSRRGFTRYRYDPGNPESLGSDEVRALLEGPEGEIWVGTQGGGVDRFDSNPPAFHRYWHQPGNPASLDANFVSVAYEDREGFLWVGTRKSLNRIDRRTGDIVRYLETGGKGKLSSSFVISIAEDRSGILWFGTAGGGLNRYDRRKDTFRVYRHDAQNPRSLSNNVVLSLLVDGNGKLWAGTEDGLSAFDPMTDSFRVYRSTDNGPNRYRYIAEDKDGTLWLATWDSGLQHLNPGTGEFKVYRHSDKPGALSSDEADAVCVDRNGTLWVGTHSGLDRFDRKTETFAVYMEHDGLPNSNLTGILEDNHGDLWVSTNNGLSRFDPRAGTFKNYSVSDGLLGNEFYGYNTPSRSAKGEMFFGSYAGLVSFFPERIIENSYVPPVVLTDFLIFGKPVLIAPETPLQKSIAYSNSLTLTHKQNDFTLEFSALSYSSPTLNRYRYRLEPLQNEWNETDSGNRSITYTQLAPGQYVFRVQGSNNRGIWNRSGVALYLRVLTPWWSTWWFRSLAAGLVLLLVWSIYFVRVWTIKQRNVELTKLNAELHQSQLELQKSERRLAQAQRIAHVGHWDFDLDSNTHLWSEECFRIHGLNPENRVLGRKDVLELAHPDDVHIIEEAIERVRAGEDHHHSEFRIIRPNGEVRILEAQGDVTRDASGRPHHIFGTIQDITERKMAEMEVRRLNLELEERVRRRTVQLASANRELEKFAYTVAHDLRGPLRHIGAFAKMLSMDYLSHIPKEAQDLLDRIANEAHRMAMLIEGLLNLSRIGRQPMELRPVDLGILVQKVIEDLQPDYTGREVEWKIGTLFTIEGDHILLYQAFVNLVSNALKFTRNRAKAIIEIGSLPSDGAEVLFVRDNGVGFDMKYRDKLFGVFQRLHRPEEFEGTGVGLATVQRIVQKHGGRVWAESELNQGASFYLTFAPELAAGDQAKLIGSASA